jgi:zinc protease
MKYLLNLLIITISFNTFAENNKAKEFMLENGMKVIVKEDHRSPVVVSQIWYKVGSSYEENGKTGLAHLLEHLMFRGTEQYTAGQFSKIMAENGADENAFTSTDYTAYFQKLEKNRLEISFKLEADRMHNLKFSQKEFDKEREVVIEERKLRTDDKPNSLMYEIFKATAYQTSPYRNPIIGWMPDLKTLTLEDAKNWYQRWYAPNNAVLIVAGDVNPQEVFELAKKYFGNLKPSEITPTISTQEVPQFGIKRITVKKPAKLPYLLMGYKTPSVKTAEESWIPYALQVISYILDGGDSSRFSQQLVRGKEIATSVSSGYDTFGRLEELFTISGTPTKNNTVETLEKAIREQLELLKTELVKEEELKRIKAQLVASKIYERDSVFYQAMQMGQLETIGLTYHLADEMVEKLSAVTPEQIQIAAQKYFVDDALTVAVLEPQPLSANTPSEKSLPTSHKHGH